MELHIQKGAVKKEVVMNNDGTERMVKAEQIEIKQEVMNSSYMMETASTVNTDSGGMSAQPQKWVVIGQECVPMKSEIKREPEGVHF